ncbi:MAG: hypothetical protein HY247_01025 [archaeon]|nr:MAG: hypothetical protein HY247_01025 [archaeon]
MIMKPTALVAAGVSAMMSLRSPVLGGLFVVFFVLFFGVLGIAKSRAAHVRVLNDAPNAFRALLAASGGLLLTFGGQFLLQSAGLFLIGGSLLLNDEYQRRAFRAARQGRRGGTVALLGIDGSGKSTHAKALARWLEARGYASEVVPFHKYLFVGALAGRGKGDLEARGRRRRGNPLRPALSLADNLMLHVARALGVGLEGKVAVFDRYVWSTFVKYQALGYPVRPLRGLYLFPRPTRALVLDVPVGKSLGVIGDREAHIRYRPEVLEEERAEYLRIARTRGYPVIDATRAFDVVQRDLEAALADAFSQGKA